MSQLTNEMEMADCPLELARNNGPENDREGEGRSNRRESEEGGRAKEPKYQRTSETVQLLLQEYLWHHALQKFFCTDTWAAAVELKWDPDGERARPGPTWQLRGGRNSVSGPCDSNLLL